jgi:hypothetical protein
MIRHGDHWLSGERGFWLRRFVHALSSMIWGPMNVVASSDEHADDLLKRGAIVGAGVAWTLPIVQVVSMSFHPQHAVASFGVHNCQHSCNPVIFA